MLRQSIIIFRRIFTLEGRESVRATHVGLLHVVLAVFIYPTHWNFTLISALRLVSLRVHWKYLEVVLVIITKSEELLFILLNSGSHCLQKDIYVSILDFSEV